MFTVCFCYNSKHKGNGVMANIISVKQQKPGAKRKTAAKIVFSIILVAALSAGAWWYFMMYKQAVKSPAELDATNRTAALAKQTAEEWKIANTEVDYEKGKATLNDQLQQAGTDVEKAKKYSQLAQLATNNGQHQEAFDYALQADGLNPTNTSARIVADKAVRLGNKAEAIKYYNLAIERTGDTTGDYKKEYLVEEAKLALENLQK